MHLFSVHVYVLYLRVRLWVHSLHMSIFGCLGRGSGTANLTWCADSVLSAPASCDAALSVFQDEARRTFSLSPSTLAMPHSHSPSAEPETDPGHPGSASDHFDHLCAAQTLRSILTHHRRLCYALDLAPARFPDFYPKLKGRSTRPLPRLLTQTEGKEHPPASQTSTPN